MAFSKTNFLNCHLHPHSSQIKLYTQDMYTKLFYIVKKPYIVMFSGKDSPYFFSFENPHLFNMYICIESVNESCSVKSNSVTPWSVAHQGPQSMEFSRLEYWNGKLYLPLGDFHNPGIEPRSFTLQADSLPSEPPGKPYTYAIASF